MRITPNTDLWDVDSNFSGSWSIVTMKDGRKLHLYIVDVDEEFQRHDEEALCQSVLIINF